MSWSYFAVNDPDAAVRWSVRLRQCLGFKQDHAFADTGDALGVTGRFVRGVKNGELTIRHRWKLIEHRWWADLDHQAAEYEAMLAAIRNVKEASITAGQLTLPLGDSAACSDKSSRGLPRSAETAP